MYLDIPNNICNVVQCLRPDARRLITALLHRVDNYSARSLLKDFFSDHGRSDKWNVQGHPRHTPALLSLVTEPYSESALPSRVDELTVPIQDTGIIINTSVITWTGVFRRPSLSDTFSSCSFSVRAVILALRCFFLPFLVLIYSVYRDASLVLLAHVPFAFISISKHNLTNHVPL